MSETLRLIKGEDNFGIYALGICKIVSHKGNIVTETDFDNGSGFYRFKVIGASKQITDRNGSPRRLKQRLFCTVSKDSVFAKIAKDLNYGDILDIFGTIKTSEYINDSGKKRRTSFCTISKLAVITRADAGQLKAESIETESEEELDDLDDF